MCIPKSSHRQPGGAHRPRLVSIRPAASKNGAVIPRSREPARSQKASREQGPCAKGHDSTLGRISFATRPPNPHRDTEPHCSHRAQRTRQSKSPVPLGRHFAACRTPLDRDERARNETTSSVILSGFDERNSRTPLAYHRSGRRKHGSIPSRHRTHRTSYGPYEADCSHSRKQTCETTLSTAGEEEKGRTIS